MQIEKKIAYITISDPTDKHSWSGTNFYIFKTLRSFYTEVVPLGPAEPVMATLFCKIIHGISMLFFKKRFDYRASTIYAKACSKLFSKKVTEQNFDLIVAPAGIACIAYLKSSIPIVFIGDRVIAGTLDYHKVISNLWKWSAKQSMQTEKLAFDNAALCVFSSPWAAEHARKYYGLPDKKIEVLPFGANMDKLPDTEEVLKNISAKGDKIKLLLVGVSWKDKGVEIALNGLDYLINNGRAAHLTIVGCTPPPNRTNSNTSIIPFLNKNNDEGLKELQQLFSESTFFILPTRFDCTPIVFCEASAFALPVLTTDTGGVAGHITTGKNGFLIPYEDKGEGFAKKIIEVLNEAGSYERLCRSSRKLYEERLNWNSWMKELATAIEKL